MLCTFLDNMFLFILVKSCVYCSLLSAQLCSRLLSRCRSTSGGGATKLFQSNRKGILMREVHKFFRHRNVV